MRNELRHEIESRLYNYCKETEDNFKWVLLIAAHLEGLEEIKLRLFEMRYKERKKEKEICDRLHIDRATYYNYISDIIQNIALIASYERLIRP